MLLGQHTLMQDADDHLGVLRASSSARGTGDEAPDLRDGSTASVDGHGALVEVAEALAWLVGLSPKRDS